MDGEKLKYQIGANIAAYRKRAGLTQAGLAEKLNYSDKAVSKWERGESVPDVLTLAMLAEQFQLTVNDLLVDINGVSAKTYGSQGQTRTAALSLKLAARDIFWQDTGEYPVLLLDDVLSELDPKRQEFVLNRIRGGQTFITCCEDDRLSSLLKGRVFHVKEGAIR